MPNPSYFRVFVDARELGSDENQGSTTNAACPTGRTTHARKERFTS